MGLRDFFASHMEKQPDSLERRKYYKFGAILGSGTFGQVRLARFTPTNQTVAVKMIKKDAIHGDANMVLKEIAVVERLNHPNIVRLLDWFESNTKYYLVFEVCTGGELFQKICQRGRFSEKDAIPFIKVCFEAIAYLHENDIVHRDIKPENLLFKHEGEGAPLMLTDFGISRIMKDSNEVLTTLCGSFGYAAPEMLTREGHGKAVDIWSMGTVLFSVLCGYAPWWKYESNQAETLRAMKFLPIEFDERYWWGISEEVKDLIRRCLDPNQHARITAADALNHPWFQSLTASDRDLLTDVKDNWQKKFQRAFNKIKAINRLRAGSSSTKSDSESEDGYSESMDGTTPHSANFPKDHAEESSNASHNNDGNGANTQASHGSSTNPFDQILAQARQNVSDNNNGTDAHNASAPSLPGGFK